MKTTAHKAIQIDRITQHGGTLLGFLGGLIAGLVIAVVVAMYITKAPVPFSNKTGHVDGANDANAGKEVQDPNQALYMKRTPAAANEENKTNATDATRLLDKKSAHDTPEKVLEKTQERVVYFLQLGAPKNESNAEGLKAKTALTGEEARITQTTINGETLYRVRTGPYRSKEDMLAARKRLSENGFEATEVKQTLVGE